MSNFYRCPQCGYPMLTEQGRCLDCGHTEIPPSNDLSLLHDEYKKNHPEKDED